MSSSHAFDSKQQQRAVTLRYTPSPSTHTRARTHLPFIRQIFTCRSSAPLTIRGMLGWNAAQFTPRSWPYGTKVKIRHEVISGWGLDMHSSVYFTHTIGVLKKGHLQETVCRLLHKNPCVMGGGGGSVTTPAQPPPDKPLPLLQVLVKRS